MDNFEAEITENFGKCKLLYANKPEIYENCEIFYDVYSTALGNIKVTECKDNRWFADDCLRCALVDDDLASCTASVAFSLEGAEINLMLQSPFLSDALCYPFALFAVLRFIERRDAAPIDGCAHEPL